MSNPLWEGVREGCGTCRFAGKVGDTYECRRRPPVLLTTSHNDPWGKRYDAIDQRRPIMQVSDWCGEYERAGTK